MRIWMLISVASLFRLSPGSPRFWHSSMSLSKVNLLQFVFSRAQDSPSFELISTDFTVKILELEVIENNWIWTISTFWTLWFWW